ncbi:MAG: EamA family transporter [Planctomycetes bacterium]|nr:EamA family transporter [Planctomycetota bacterium]
MTQSVREGRIWIAVAALLWSSCGLFAKSPLFEDWPPEHRGVLLAFWRALFVAVSLLPLVRRPRWRRELVPLVIGFTGMNATYLSSVVLTTAANAIWLQSTSPFWVLLISVFLFHRPVNRRDLVPVACAAVGVGAILWCELQGAAWSGVALGVTSGVCFAVVVLSMSALRDENGPWIILVCNATAALVFLPWLVWLQVWPSWQQLGALAVFGAFQMAAPYVCLARGLRSISSQEAVAIGLIEPVLMPVWVYLVWGEAPAWWTIIGAALILVGLLIRYTILERRQPAPVDLPESPLPAEAPAVVTSESA